MRYEVVVSNQLTTSLKQHIILVDFSNIFMVMGPMFVILV